MWQGASIERSARLRQECAKADQFSGKGIQEAEEKGEEKGEGDDVIEQFGIALCGLSAVFLSQDPRPKCARWACVFGLTGQPFWFYATFKAGQWGIFALCFLYAFSWARGIRTHWMARAG